MQYIFTKIQKEFIIIILFLAGFNYGLAELPEDFPKINIDTLSHPTPGFTFMNSISFSGKTVNYNFIIDSVGNVVYYQKPKEAAIDFKMQSNGLFSYGSPLKMGSKYQVGPILVQNVMVQWNVLDSAYNPIDTVQMQNGYLADVHDFQILPNGHYLLMSYEVNPIDMSKVCEGGDPNANVVGTVIQELDQNKKCIFQWRSTDFIPITDTFDDLTKKSFEHVHGNSLFIDTDGNLISSFATTCDIAKIDMISGDILWRLGGKKNEFKFNNEHDQYSPMYFSMQHDVKKLSNGNLLFYDNGVGRKDWFSRAVEYSIDEKNKEVSLVWEYRHKPDISAFAMGSVQRLNNGNTYIDWGLIFKGLYRSITEVNSNNEKQFELSLPSDSYSYRAYKFDLPGCRPVADIDKYEILEGNTYTFKNTNISTGVQIYFKKIDGFMYNLLNVKKYNCSSHNPLFEGEAPVILPFRYVLNQNEIKSFSGEVKFEIASLPKLMNPEKMIVYNRPKEGEGVFVELPTSIDANNKYIVAQANDFGEFVIGLERNFQNIKAPTLIYPFDKKSFVNNLPVIINWSPTGRYDNFNVQISTDNSFTTLITDTANVSETRLTMNLNPNSTYFWRVRTNYNNNWSDWSAIREFTLREPYVKIISPNGGETWFKDSSYVIRWETNLPDSVKITLLKNDEDNSIVKDSLYSYFNGQLWLVPANVPDGNFYKIKVQGIKDGSLLAESETNFTITTPVSVNDDLNNAFSINCYPNPTQGKTIFEFNIEKEGLTNISISDLFGNQIAEIFSDYLTPGKYKIDWDGKLLSSGIYFYKITNGFNSKVNKLIINK